jgi:dihydropteroate synthase
MREDAPSGLSRHAIPDSREATPGAWRVRGALLTLARPRLAAILNVTPDSFSDGGRFSSLDAALARADAALSEGADLIDVGGESTRPGASRTDQEEELRRVLPVLRGIRRRHQDALLSIDTTRGVVARAALDEGANVVNDVSGLRLDDTLGAAAAEAGAGLVLMHSRGSVTTMASYDLATYGHDPVGEILAELDNSVERALAAGVARDQIVLDPGIGFSKRSEHSLAVLRELPRIVDKGFPVMVGASRKRVVGELTGVAVPAERVHGSVGVHISALVSGARLFRVHDVSAHRQALDAAWSVLVSSGE